MLLTYKNLNISENKCVQKRNKRRKVITEVSLEVHSHR
jgi:hypothetical protein